MTSGITAARTTFAVRRGPVGWLRAYLIMLRWELTSLRLVVPITIAVQLLAGAGFAVGIGLFRDLPERDALFLTTGTAVVTLVMVGLILGPQLIAQQKVDNTYDFLWSLPIPRTAAAAAWTTMTVALGLPGMVAAVAVAVWRYDLTIHLGWSILPAVLLTGACGGLVGYALAHAVANPMVTLAATQVMIFLLIGFSPVNFPPERLPGWLDRLHDWLPFEPMATVIRGALAPQLADSVGRPYLVLAAWLVAMIAVTGAVLGRRG